MKLWPFCVERRATARHLSEIPAEFVVRESFSGKLLSPPCPGQVLNLSPRGCCLALGQLDCGGFHLHRCLEAPQDYVLDLSLRENRDAPRLYQAEVRWLNRELEAVELPFRAGLAFFQID